MTDNGLLANQDSTVGTQVLRRFSIAKRQYEFTATGDAELHLEFLALTPDGEVLSQLRGKYNWTIWRR